MRLLTGADIAALTEMPALIDVIAQAMIRVSARDVELPLRMVMPLPAGNRFGIMPGWLAGPAGHGAKLLSLYPDNPKQGRSSHAGLMLVFDPLTGLPRGCLAAAALTALRTAAATAVATRTLARANASTLALIGCGEQAASHLAALRYVRDLSRVVVWGRDPSRAAAFAAQHGIETAPSIEAAVAMADIVCTVTDARTPLLHPGMLRPGLHINAVGASVPVLQEIATECVPAVRLFTDYLPSLEAQAAEVIDARARGLIGAAHQITEIGAVLGGAASGRGNANETTMYRSLGVAAQDLAAADYLLQRAEQAGRGIVADMD